MDITIPPLPINVKPSSTAPAPAEPETAKSDTAARGRAAAHRRAGDDGPRGKTWTLGAFASAAAPRMVAACAELAPPLLLLALWAWRRRRDWLAANPQIIRRRRAHAAARRALARARVAARTGDRWEFLRASAGALREAASPLDTARADSLTREDVLRLLNDDAGASEVARKVLDSADAANYSTAEAAAMEPGHCCRNSNGLSTRSRAAHEDDATASRWGSTERRGTGLQPVRPGGNPSRRFCSRN